MEFVQDEKVREEGKTGEDGKVIEEGKVGEEGKAAKEGEEGMEEKMEDAGKEGKDGEEGENTADSVVESKMERATCYEYGVHHSGFPLK